MSGEPLFIGDKHKLCTVNVWSWKTFYHWQIYELFLLETTAVVSVSRKGVRLSTRVTTHEVGPLVQSVKSRIDATQRTALCGMVAGMKCSLDGVLFSSLVLVGLHTVG